MLFDNKDGVNIQYELLPYVDRYFKKQLFKNRSLYKKNYYGNRIYTDYYVKNYNLNKEFKILKETTLNSKYNPKISLSWNIALSDYRSSNILTPFSYNFLNKIKLKFKEPSINR